MNLLLAEHGLSQQEICKHSDEIVKRYSNSDLKLHHLTMGTVHRMLRGKLQKYSYKKVLTFYLVCRHQTWLEQGRSADPPTVEEARDFYTACVRASFSSTRSESAICGKSKAPAHTEEVQESFDLERRRVMENFGQHGMSLLSAAGEGDPDAALSLAILSLLAGRFADGRKWAAQAKKDGSNSVAELMRTLADPVACQEVAAELAVDISYNFEESQEEVAVLYLELASKCNNTRAAYRLSQIYEQRNEHGKSGRYIAEAEGLGYSGV